MSTRSTRLALSLCIVGTLTVAAFGGNSADERKQIELRIGDQPFAHYVFNDPVITRPYFCNVRTPSGIQVTRNHPIKQGDTDDHPTMHPGIWLAFGDLSGHDYWRLKAKIEHVRFVDNPRDVAANHHTFTVENAYQSTDGQSTVCSETCRYDLHAVKDGTLLVATSEFSGTNDFYFGDQEEMGLGVRLATPIAVNQKKGGRILDSERRLNGTGVWGKQASWCDYSGSVQGRPVGIAIFPSPKNFRKSWWHARDYGFVAANPFGKAAFEKGEKSKTIVSVGRTFRVQFGVFVHEDLPRENTDLSSKSVQRAYETYLKKAEWN